MTRPVVLAVVLASSLCVVIGVALSDRPTTSSAPAEKKVELVSAEERAEAITRAQVWRRPKEPIARANLAGPNATLTALDCRFKVTELGGTTPKFHCIADAGKEIRTRYGRGSEIPAEAAATRLLSALGFGADSITIVERLRCYGCPAAPFVTTKAAGATRTEPLLARATDYESYQEFEWVATEEKFTGTPIEAEGQEGWSFFELETVDPSKGGAPRAHVDALRLLAVFLAHWDNKAANQRLVCLSDSSRPGAPCRDPFLMLQDVGATFGPKKADLAGWEAAPIWEDRPTCAVTMKGFPYEGATFPSLRISEEGRQFLVALLRQLSDSQLTDLFTAARFDQPRNILKPVSPVAEWVRVFKARVETLSDGPRCPPA